MSVKHAVDRFDCSAEKAFDAIRGNALSDRVFYAASTLGDHSLIWLLFGSMRGLRSQSHWRAATRVTAALAVESALVNIGIKSMFRRTRPVHDKVHPHRLRQPLTTSFPSGHATSAFMAAGLLAENDDWWPLYYLSATIVSASRIHVRIHHASDVVGGVAIGIVLGHIGRKLIPLTPKQ